MRGLFGTRISWWLLERVTGRSVNCMQHTSQIKISIREGPHPNIGVIINPLKA